MDSTFPCFPCSPHSSNQKCQEDRIPAATEDNQTSTFHTDGKTVNPAINETDHTTQEKDTATDKIDPANPGVIEKGTSTLEPEKDNYFTLHGSLLQNRKRDRAVIPLEEKHLDHKPYNKAKPEISHTASKHSNI